MTKINEKNVGVIRSENTTLYRQTCEMFGHKDGYYAANVRYAMINKSMHVHETQVVDATYGSVDDLIKELQEWNDEHLDTGVDLESVNQYGDYYTRLQVGGWRKATEEEEAHVKKLVKFDKDKRAAQRKQQQDNERQEYERLKKKFKEST